LQFGLQAYPCSSTVEFAHFIRDPRDEARSQKCEFSSHQGTWKPQKPFPEKLATNLLRNCEHVRFLLFNSRKNKP
jgi:hypothetical protein